MQVVREQFGIPASFDPGTGAVAKCTTPHPAKGMSEAQVSAFESIADKCNHGAYGRTIEILMEHGLILGPPVKMPKDYMKTDAYQVVDKYKQQLDQWRVDTGRVDRYFDLDENEVKEDDPRAAFRINWRWGDYDCIARCNDDNCVCCVDDPDNFAEIARREKLLRDHLQGLGK
jgi:hypothetical protein